MSYILVADDDPGRVLRVRRWLEGAGYLVHVVPDRPDVLDSVPLRVGDLVMDTIGHRVTIDDREIMLTVAEFRILHALASTPNRTHTRAELLDRHGTSPRGSTSLTTTARAVDGHIRRIRQKIGPGRIETVRGVGYRLPWHGGSGG